MKAQNTWLQHTKYIPIQNLVENAKYEKCWYNFGKYFTECTILSLPFSSDLPKAEKSNILNEREHILSTVNQCIDNSLDPRKYNIFNLLKQDFEEISNIKNILTELGLTEEQYYNTLLISSDSDLQTDIRRASYVCFINNFLSEGLQAWEGQK